MTLLRYRLEAIVFISGAVVMILELVGTRLVAPFFGSSLPVWTSLIGVVLASLSLGYWLGGTYADRHPSPYRFAWILLAAGFLIGLIAVCQHRVLTLLGSWLPDYRWGALVAALVLFFPASTLLGMVSPFAVRLKLRTIDQSGKTVGRLYAISTVGSIAGTFLGGFWLIHMMGSVKIVALLAVTMVIVGLWTLLGAPRKRPGAMATAVLLLAATIAGWIAPVKGFDAIADIDTPYSRVIVEERTFAPDSRTARILRVDQQWGQSAIWVDAPEQQYFQYGRFYRLVDHFAPHCRRALMIGGGAYTQPRDFLLRHPRAVIDVVEIDPVLTELAYAHFALRPDPRMTIFHEDGRTFIRRAQNRYEAIFLDVYKSAATPPFHLATVEAFEQIRFLLTPDGVFLMNVFAAIEGDAGRLLRGLHATAKKVFAQVILFPVEAPGNGRRPQNIIIVARMQPTVDFTSDDAELSRYLAHRWEGKVAGDVPLLTDDFAPVAHYLAPVLAFISLQQP